MPRPTPLLHDVVIAGAGPVGLFLACELRLAGCAVLILEEAPDPDTPLKHAPFGLRGLTLPSVESFDRRGLLDPIKDQAAGPATPGTAHWMTPERRPGGHFAGIPFVHDATDSARRPHRLPGPAEAGLAVTLAHVEAVLAARARTLGVEVRRGLRVEGVDASDDAVAVHAGGATFHGRWLVGCDGGRSAVRKAGGFAFVGTEPEFTGYSVALALADPDGLPAGRHHTPTGMYTFARPGTVAMVAFDGGAFHRTRPITRAHVQAVLRRVSGLDVTVTALELATTWTDRAFQATAYRRGRVLLAGDAAHVHAPLGGQGLNLGLGDAMNLGWKLAATIRGGAPDGLLDTYARERHPVGAQVLDWSRAQVALMRPTPGTRALAAVVRDLIGTRDGAAYCAERVSGVALRHDLGGGHPLVGRSAPEFVLTDGTRLGEHLRTGRGLLLDFDARGPLRDLAAPWQDRIIHVARDAVERLGLRAVLVRPDGIVAWASDDAPDEAEAGAAMTRWFGDRSGLHDRPLRGRPQT